MSQRPVPAVRSEQARRNASAARVVARLLDVADRPRRIDQYVDYFGERGVRRDWRQASAETSVDHR